MSAAEDEYDKLSPEQRDAKDKADRDREAAEQASELIDPSARMRTHIGASSPPIHMEAGAWRR